MVKINSLFFIFVPLVLCLLSPESQAFPERKVDTFSGKVTISSTVNDTTANRVFVNKSIGLAFKSVAFSKTLETNKSMPEVEKTLYEPVIKERIEADETLFKMSRRFCTISDINKINTALELLSQAKVELQKKSYQSADYFEWKARSIYGTIKTEAYTLTLKITYMKDWWFFSQDDFEIKIDNNPEVYKLSVLDTNSTIGGNNSLTTSVTIEVPNDMVRVINRANRLTCKVYFSDSNKQREPSMFEINGSILNEWQNVIRSE